jgi:hypothetical protein
MSARFYSPGLGTFTQLDSVMGSAQNPLSMNRFLYALANPATLIDPTGHASINSAQLCPYGPEDCAGLNFTPKPHVYGPSGGGGGGGRSSGGTSETGKKSHGPRWRTPDKGKVSGKHRNFAAEAEQWRQGGCSIVELNCTLGDIQRMTFVERAAWISTFQYHYDQGRWLSALAGFVYAARDTHMSDTGWLSTVDARVLIDIQDGYVASRHDWGAGELSWSVGNWAAFWTGVRRDDGSEAMSDVLNRLVAAAENSSINTGRDEAWALGRRPTTGEALGYLGSNAFRLGQTHRPIVRDIIGSACGANPVCDAVDARTFASSRIVNGVIDEHNFAVGYNGAYLAFSQTYSPMTPRFDLVEWLMPDLP